MFLYIYYIGIDVFDGFLFDHNKLLNLLKSECLSKNFLDIIFIKISTIEYCVNPKKKEFYLNNLIIIDKGDFSCKKPHTLN